MGMGTVDSMKWFSYIKAACVLLLIALFLACDCYPRNSHLNITIVNNSESDVRVLKIQGVIDYTSDGTRFSYYEFNKDTIVPAKCIFDYSFEEPIEWYVSKRDSTDRLDIFLVPEGVEYQDKADEKQELLDVNKDIIRKYSFSYQQLIDCNFTLIYP